MYTKAYLRAFNIKNLLNQLQGSMTILSSLKKLEYNIPQLYFKYYTNHINTIQNICKKDLTCKLSWKLFRKLFEGDNDFKDYSLTNEHDAKILISINKEQNPEKIQLNLSDKRFGKDYGLSEEILQDLVFILKKLKINGKLIWVFILNFINNQFTVPSLMEEISPLLKEKYPKGVICLENINQENITIKDFIKNMKLVAQDFDNYTKLIWNSKKKVLQVIAISNEEILNDINNEENAKILKKKTKDLKIKEEENANNNHDKKSEKNYLSEENSTYNDLNQKVVDKKPENDEETEKPDKINDNLNKEIEELTIKLLECNQKIIEKDYYLTMIGLRTAFKAFIDIFVYLFRLNEKSNLDLKVEEIEKFIGEDKNYKKINIKKSIKDVKDLLKSSNLMAHSINFDKSLTEQIFEALNFYKFNKNEDQSISSKANQKDIYDLFDYFKINDIFKELVLIRSKKFNMDYSTYISEERKIINKIKNHFSDGAFAKFIND